jgi:mRNA interferase YafQ
MRLIKKTAAFRKDIKRESKGQNLTILNNDLPVILAALKADSPLPRKCKDHDLEGGWSGYRECHIRPDLLLIYRKIGSSDLELARLGSHSELFGK